MLVLVKTVPIRLVLVEEEKMKKMSDFCLFASKENQFNLKSAAGGGRFDAEKSFPFLYCNLAQNKFWRGACMPLHGGGRASPVYTNLF